MANNGKFQGHKALVAGPSNPTGFAIAKSLVEDNCQLYMADYNEQALKTCSEKIKEIFNTDVEIHHMDLSQPINVAVLALECQDANIVINNLGTPKMGGINQLDQEDWKTSFELSLFAAINLTGEVLDSLYEHKSGIIINVGGMIIGADVENLCTVSMNSALQAFSKTIDKRTKVDGIRVLCFLPQANISPEKNATVLKHLILEGLSP